MSKFTIRMIPVLAVLLLAGVQHANAQGVSAYFGMGSAFDSAATSPTCSPKNIIDPINGGCVPAPTMGGVFGVIGADFMITPHLGFNTQYSFRFAQANYLAVDGLNVRPGFYDFNAVYEPSSGDRHVVPVLEGGVGGAKLSFYGIQSGVFSSSQLLGSSNHFQVHGGVGVKLYVKSDIFIKPQFDIHYVPHLTDQYGRNTVPQFTISIGYTFGRQ